MQSPTGLRRSAFPLRLVIPLLALLSLITARSEDTEAVRRGSELAHKHCITCHAFPEPEALDRTAWFEQILPRMKWRLGFTTPQLNLSTNIKILRANGRIPNAPVITESEWLDLAAYYFTNSPALLPPSPRARVEVGLKRFATLLPEWRQHDPAITAVSASVTPGTIWVADEHGGLLHALDANGKRRFTLSVSNSVASLRPDPRGVLIGGLGQFQPTDNPVGSAFLLSQTGTDWSRSPDLLSGLPRMPDAVAADLNGDGRSDLAISAFGNNLGRFSWFENLLEGGYREHVLVPLPGALRCEVADFDGDGRPDLAVLVAQETEALYLFLNQGHGQFRRETVFQTPPYFGHTYFEAVDFDRDGRLDFVVTNGDNGEFNSPPKACHGIRVYLNVGGLRYQEALFFPMYGAYRALARDFDGDGDMDVAAVAYFPDFFKRSKDAFLYLENQGAMRFTASTIPEMLAGRWLTEDAGDLDGDGDLDLVLGSYIHGPREVPRSVMDSWERGDLPVLILKNTTR